DVRVADVLLRMRYNSEFGGIVRATVQTNASRRAEFERLATGFTVTVPIIHPDYNEEVGTVTLEGCQFGQVWATGPVVGEIHCDMRRQVTKSHGVFLEEQTVATMVLASGWAGPSTTVVIEVEGYRLQLSSVPVEVPFGSGRVVVKRPRLVCAVDGVLSQKHRG